MRWKEPTRLWNDCLLHGYALSFRHFLAKMPPPSRREAMVTCAFDFVIFCPWCEPAKQYGGNLVIFGRGSPSRGVNTPNNAAINCDFFGASKAPPPTM